MADEKRIIYLEINAKGTERGSTEATRALAAIDKATASTASSLDRMEASLGRVGGYLKAHLALMLADVAARFVQMGKDAFNAASGLDELAEQLGITAKGLQGLQFSAVQNGAKLEQLETGIGKFSQKMGEAAEGSKEMIEALDKLGVKNLDLQGKLRPTEDLLQDVATAIMAIDDPARRSAAAVDFFGKAGTRLLPMLKDIAAGTDAMAAKAALAGALIGSDVITKLDKLADSAAIAGLKMRAFAANGIVDIAEWAERNRVAIAVITGGLSEVVRHIDKVGPAFNSLTTGLGNIGADVKQAFYNINVEAAAARGRFVDAFTGIGADLKSVFVDAMNGVIETVEKGLNHLEKGAKSWFTKNVGPGSVSIPRLGGASVEPSTVMTNEQVMRQNTTDAFGGRRDYRQELQVQRDQYATQLFVSGSFGPTTPPSTGGGLSAVKGSGKAAEDAAKKYEKLMATLGLTVAAQDKMTEAAANGEAAYSKVKIELEAQQKAYEIFNEVLDKTDPRLQAIIEKLEKIATGKAREAFSEQTNELERQNVVLEAQIRLRNELPEVQARELAAIKVAQDAKKTGATIDQAEIDRRLKVVEVGETLKLQGEELKRSQELWTEPLKSALSSIQSTAADAFEGMLESGKFNFQELGQVFKKMVIRMAAEWLALATVRPVMSVLVNAVSPGMARQFGLDSGSAGGATGMSGGGGGLFGGGGFGDLFSGIGNSLSSAWDRTAGFFGHVPKGGYSDVGALINAQGLGQSSIFGSGIGWGQGLGALAGAGMGAYQLLSGGGSTSSTIGGIASLVGAGVSLIPGIGQIAGPIIGLLGGLLPGLFEQPKKPPKLMATGGLNFNAGKFNYSGSEYNGGKGLGGPLGSTGNTMKMLLDASGVTSTTSSNSLNYQTLSQGEFSNMTSFVNGKQWGQSSEGDGGLDTAAAHVAHKIMMELDSGITDFMREGLGGFGLKNLDHAFSTQELGTAVEELKSLETIMKDLGRTVPGVETALKAIDDQFKSIKDSAEKYGLDTTKIVDEEAKARTKVGTDFAEGIQRGLDDMLDPNKGLLADLEKEKQAAIDTNAYIVANVTDALDQILKIEELYGKKRAEIVEAAADEANAKAWSTGPLARGQYLFTQRQGFNTSIAAMNDDTAAISAGPMASVLKALGRERDLFIGSAQKVFGAGSEESYAATVSAYAKFNAQMKAENDNFIQTMEDALLDPFELQIEQLTRQKDAAMEAAHALDASGKLAEQAAMAYLVPLEKLAADLESAATDSSLAIKSPLEHTLKGLQKERDEALKQAKQVNDALGEAYYPLLMAAGERLAAASNNYAGTIDAITGLVDKSGAALSQDDLAFYARANEGYVDLLKIEQAYLDKKLKAEQDYYAASIANLQDLIDRAKFGDLSGASPVTVFNEQQAAYADVRSKAFSGDEAALQEFAGQGGDYLNAAKNYYAFTPEYFALRDQVKADSEELKRKLSSGQTPSGGGTLSPDVLALMDRLDRAQAANDDKQQQIDRFLAEQANLNSLLQRYVANGR